MEPLAIVADVTSMETRPPAHPEQVAALEARGFRQLGRVATLARPTRDDSAYSREERARLEDWRLRPAATALAAPDGSSFAGVDTFGEARLLRLRTELDDRSVVETVGVERAGMLRPRFRRDPLTTFRVVRTADHSVVVTDDPTPDALITAHADHVATAAARRGAGPVRHADLDHALRLATEHADHMSRVVHRSRLVFRVLGIVLLLLLAVPVFAIQVARPLSSSTVVLLDLGMLVAWIGAMVLLLTPLFRMTWWRPPYVLDR